MSYRKYDPELEYWKEEEDEFTVYKPTKSDSTSVSWSDYAKKSDIEDDFGSYRKQRSAYGRSHSYATEGNPSYGRNDRRSEYNVDHHFEELPSSYGDSRNKNTSSSSGRAVNRSSSKKPSRNQKNSRWRNTYEEVQPSSKNNDSVDTYEESILMSDDSEEEGLVSTKSNNNYIPPHHKKYGNNRSSDYSKSNSRTSNKYGVIITNNEDERNYNIDFDDSSGSSGLAEFARNRNFDYTSPYNSNSVNNSSNSKKLRKSKNRKFVDPKKKSSSPKNNENQLNNWLSSKANRDINSNEKIVFKIPPKRETSKKKKSIKDFLPPPKTEEENGNNFSMNITETKEFSKSPSLSLSSSSSSSSPISFENIKNSSSKKAPLKKVEKENTRKIVNQKLRKPENYDIPVGKFDKCYFEELKFFEFSMIQNYVKTLEKCIVSVFDISKVCETYKSSSYSFETPNSSSSSDEIIDIQPNMIKILRNTPLLLNSYPDQIKELNSKLKLNPNDIDSLRQLVLCQATLKKYKDAKKSIHKALAISPKDTLIYDFKVIVCEETDEIEEAISSLEKLFEYDKKNLKNNKKRKKKLILRWFEKHGENEPKLNNNYNSIHLNFWNDSNYSSFMKYAKLAIQYWTQKLQLYEKNNQNIKIMKSIKEIQNQKQKQLEKEETEGENEDELDIKSFEKYSFLEGNQNFASFLLHCLYFSFGLKKFPECLEYCERLEKWFFYFIYLKKKEYIHGVEVKQLEIKKVKNAIWMIRLIKSFCFQNQQSYEKSLENSCFTKLRKFEYNVVDELLIHGMKILIHKLEVYLDDKSTSSRLKFENFYFLRNFLYSTKIKFMSFLNLSKSKKLLETLKDLYLSKISVALDYLKAPKNALNDVNELIKMFPKNADFYLLRSKIYGSLGEKTRSSKDLMKYEDLSPKITNFKQFKRKFENLRNSVSLKIAKKNSNNLQDHFFDEIFNIKDRLRKMDEPMEKLFDYINLDSAPHGKLENAIHYLTKSVKLDPSILKSHSCPAPEFLLKIKNEIKIHKFCGGFENCLNVNGFKKFADTHICMCYDFIPGGETLEDYIISKKRNRNLKNTGHLSSIQKWEILSQLATIIKQFHNFNIILRNVSPKSCVAQKIFSPIIGNRTFQKQQDAEKTKIQWYDLNFAIFKNEYLPEYFEILLMNYEFELFQFRAPEVILDISKYSKKSDIYSFGLLMYFVVTGLYPFMEDRNNHVLQLFKIYKNNIPFLSNNKNQKQSLNVPIDEEFKSLLESCLDHDPAKRPSINEICSLITKKKSSRELKQRILLKKQEQDRKKQEELEKLFKIKELQEKMKIEYNKKLTEKEKELEKKNKMLIEKEKLSILETKEKLEKNFKILEKKEEEEKKKNALKQLNNNSETKLSKQENEEREKLKRICLSLDNLKNLLQCPISLELFEEPTLVVESGGIYEKVHINRWLKKHRTDPITNQVLLSKKRMKLKHLKNIVEEWKKTQVLINSNE